MHLLMAYGAKAKRVCYSTSHGETLAMVGGIETGTLCMIRMAEVYHEKRSGQLYSRWWRFRRMAIQTYQMTAMETAGIFTNFAQEVDRFHKTRHNAGMFCQSKNPD